MSIHRPITGPDLGTTQQSLAVNRDDYRHFHTYGLMVGVVLDVTYSDNEYSYDSITQADRRGSFHEAKVLVVNSNMNQTLLLEHVRITPDCLSGLDDYCEHLPRPSRNRVTGEPLENNLTDVDPNSLDGDWCVVGFINGSLDHPFILRWWPHPANRYDPATSGAGNPNSQGNAQALDQSERFFRRVNGVEQVITKTGDVCISTYLAGSTLKFGDEPATRGRYPRTENADVGGSVLLEVKPSQTLEISFEEPVEGKGLQRSTMDELPQTNPRPPSNNSSSQRQNTYVYSDKDSLKVLVNSEFAVKSATRVSIECDDTTVVTSTNLLELDSASIKLGVNADSAQGVPRGNDLKNWLDNLTVLTPMGPAYINQADIEIFTSQVVSTKVIVE